MYQRILNIDKYLDDSIFLFGARQTGKSTFLKMLWKGEIINSTDLR